MTGDPKSRPGKVRELARDIEANEDEKAFEETLKKVTAVPKSVGQKSRD